MHNHTITHTHTRAQSRTTHTHTHTPHAHSNKQTNTKSNTVQVFVLGLDLTVQAPQETVHKLFPRLDDLISIHHRFGCALRERQNEYEKADFFVERIGDVLLSFVRFSLSYSTTLQLIYILCELCCERELIIQFYSLYLYCTRTGTGVREFVYMYSIYLYMYLVFQFKWRCYLSSLLRLHSRFYTGETALQTIDHRHTAPL